MIKFLFVIAIKYGITEEKSQILRKLADKLHVVFAPPTNSPYFLPVAMRLVIIDFDIIYLPVHFLCYRRTVSTGTEVDHGRSMGPKDKQTSAGHIETAFHPRRPNRRSGCVAHRQRGRVASQIRKDHDRHRSSRYR